MYQPERSRSNAVGKLKNGLRMLGTLALAGMVQLSLALESDRFQPIDVAADSAILDDKAGKAIYRGNVVLTQGSLKINADQLTIEAGTQGKVEKVIATGDLAHFEQTPNENDKPIEARANTVEYYVANEKVVLIENARVVQNDNLFEGNIIEYDIKAQKLQAHGKALTAEGSDQEQTGRVKMVLQPQTETGRADNADKTGATTPSGNNQNTAPENNTPTPAPAAETETTGPVAPEPDSELPQQSPPETKEEATHTNE